MDSDKRRVLLDALRGGADLNTAAQFAGFNLSAIYRVIEHGQRGNERLERGEEPTDSERECIEVWQAMRKARADAIVRNVTQIQKAANQGEWKAAAWWLERVLPETYAKRPALDQTAGESSHDLTP